MLFSKHTPIAVKGNAFFDLDAKLANAGSAFSNASRSSAWVVMPAPPDELDGRALET